MVIKIESVELKNFRIHKDLKLDFGDGTNLIIGENGTGKSSIFIGIIYALFGAEALSSYEKSGKKSNLVRRGSSKGYVTLILNVDGTKYLIKRTVPDGDAYLAKLKDGRWIGIATGNNTTKKVLEEIFGVRDVRRLINVIYIRQRSLGSLVYGSGKVELSKKLEELLNIKKYNDIYDVVRYSLKLLKERLQYVKDDIAIKEKNIKEILGSYSIEELEKIATRRKELQNELIELKNIKSKLESLEKFIDANLINEEDKIRKELSEVNKRIKELDLKLNELREKIKDIRIIRNDFKEYLDKNISEILKIVKELRAYGDINKERVYYKLKKLVDIREKIMKIQQAELSDIESKIEELENKLREMINKEGEIKNKIGLTKDIIEILEKYNKPVCPVCGSEIKNKENLLESKREELRRLKDELKDIQEKIEKLRVEINRIRKNHDILKNLIDEVRITLNVETYDVSTLKDIVDREIEELKQEYEKAISYEKAVSALSYIKKRDIDDMIKSIIKSKSHLERVKDTLIRKISKIEEMKRKIEEINRIKDTLNEKGIINLDQEIEKIENEIKRYPDIGIDLVKNIKRELELLDRLKKYKEELEDYVKTLEEILILLTKFKMRIRVAIAEKLTHYLNYWFKRIYIYPDIVKVFLKVEQGKTDFVYKLYVRKIIDGKSIDLDILEAGLSGGQLIALDLAFRFALATFISRNISFILLDEPTESLDENIRRKLAELLKELKDIQVIVCTHDEIFKEALSSYGYIFKREKNEIIVSRI